LTKNIDISSDEFQVELEKTWKFLEKVNKQFGFVQNPDKEVNEGVALGLARNRLIYGKRYCPCFIVQGKTEQERKEADNRICPCKPALEKEIPKDGLCHCGIFCTPEYIKKKAKENVEEAVCTHSKDLNKEEVKVLLHKEQLDGYELELLLKNRELGVIKFSLIDVREPIEFQMGHIAEVDELLPTSQFYDWINKLQNRKDENIILYCRTGNRSLQIQQMLKKQGFKHIGNLIHGIVGYLGELKTE